MTQCQHLVQPVLPKALHLKLDVKDVDNIIDTARFTVKNIGQKKVILVTSGLKNAFCVARFWTFSQQYKEQVKGILRLTKSRNQCHDLLVLIYLHLTPRISSDEVLSQTQTNKHIDHQRYPQQS